MCRDLLPLDKCPLLIALKSCTNLYSLFGFFAGNIGVLNSTVYLLQVPRLVSCYIHLRPSPWQRFPAGTDCPGETGCSSLGIPFSNVLPVCNTHIDLGLTLA